MSVCWLLVCKFLLAIFREEESLVDMFVVEMLVVLIHSLKMAHRDDRGLGKHVSISLLAWCMTLDNQ